MRFRLSTLDTSPRELNSGRRVPGARPPRRNQLLEEPAEGWQVREEGLEGVAVHGQHVDARQTPDRRRACLLADQGDLAEALARAQAAEREVARARHALRHLHLTVHEDVEQVAPVPLAEDDL